MNEALTPKTIVATLDDHIIGQTEAKRAVAVARERDLAVELIDREVGLTFRRASASLGFFGKLKLASGLVAGLLSSEEMDEAEIEKLKEGDILESTFGEFAQSSPALYESVIAERDHLASKPAPDVFVEAARMLEVDPARSVAVEDAISGVQSAVAGGFALVIGVDRGTGPDELRSAGADLIVEDLAELLRHTDSTRPTNAQESPA